MAKKKVRDIPLSGKLVTAVEGTQIGSNYSTLKNLRYRDGYNGLVGVGGMAKINTTALTSYLKVRNAFHYRKSFPASESHVITQAWDSGLTGSSIIENTTAIPSQGDFSATAVFSEASGASFGRFSSSPSGEMAYCNGLGAYLYGGNESKISKCINFDLATTYESDITEIVNNSRSSGSDVFTFSRATGTTGNDANTILLLHFDNNVTDSSATAHTVTNSGATFDAGDKVFGTHSASFDGTNDYMTIPDHASFTLGSTWSMDFRMKINAAADQTEKIIWYQGTDANNYAKISIYGLGSNLFGIKLYSRTSAGVHHNYSLSLSLARNTWYHVEVDQEASALYLFIDGYKALTSYITTSFGFNYTGEVYIGQYGSANYFHGLLDEFRVSDITRNTVNFSIPSAAYGAAASQAEYLYLGSLVPLSGFKVYVGNANSAASTLAVTYWNGAAWTGVTSLSDGTASGGVTFAQSGTVTFDSTSDIAKIKVINQIVIYWYRIGISAISNGSTIYQITNRIPFQLIKDIWDGADRQCLSCQYYHSSAYNDNTVGIAEEDYSSADTASYLDISSMASASDYIYLGFVERQTALSLTFVTAKVNANASNLTVSYWDGDAWTSVGTITDGTDNGGKTLGQSGTVSWNAPQSGIEFKKEIGKKFPLYYYRLSVSANLSANTFIDYLAGIPAQNTIGSYRFPMIGQDRLWLCNSNDSDVNAVMCSALGTSVVFNGDDSIKIYFGDSTEIVAATSLFTQFGSNLYNILAFFKTNETWVVSGGGPDSWVKYQASDRIGCVAPLTMTTIHIDAEIAPGMNQNVVIWQGSDGIYLFDGKAFTPIHTDIKDVFDKNSSTKINASMASKSVAFYNDFHGEWHWLFASGTSTTLNKELVFDIRNAKWFEIDRGSYLQAGVTVSDTNGNRYNYGFLDSGYMERLEYGNTFDGTSIAQTFTLGELALGKSLFDETQVRAISLIGKVKANTTNSISYNHYIDGCSTANKSVTDMSPLKSGFGISLGKSSLGNGWGVFHSMSFSLTTSNETYGFEPYSLGVLYDSKLDATVEE